MHRLWNSPVAWFIACLGRWCTECGKRDKSQKRLLVTWHSRASGCTLHLCMSSMSEKAWVYMLEYAHDSTSQTVTEIGPARCLRNPVLHMVIKPRKKPENFISPPSAISGERKLGDFKWISIWLSLKFTSRGFCHLMVCFSHISVAANWDVFRSFLLQFMLMFNEFLCNTHILEKRITSLLKQRI